MRARAGVAAASALVLAGHAGPAVSAVGEFRRAVLPRLAGIGRPDHVALTFDDGPDRSSTPRFLEALDRLDVRATFFLLGEMVERHRGVAQEIVAAGHEVAVHGYAHRLLPLRGPLAAMRDIGRGHAVVRAATGVRPRFFRPPYGYLSAAGLAAARREGLTPVLWSCWGRDWVAGASPAGVVTTVLRDLDGGATVLLHDSDCTSAPGSWRVTLAALPDLVALAWGRGWTVGPLAEHGLAPRGGR